MHDHAAVNKMTSNNLGIVFGPTLLCASPDTPIDTIMYDTPKCQVRARSADAGLDVSVLCARLLLAHAWMR